MTVAKINRKVTFQTIATHVNAATAMLRALDVHQLAQFRVDALEAHREALEDDIAAFTLFNMGKWEADFRDEQAEVKH